MKQTNSDFSKKLFCMMLCLCMIFSQMSFALADVDAGDGSEPGETPSEENVHRTHYHYNAETGECDGDCVVADFAGKPDELKAKLSEKNGVTLVNPRYYIDDLEGWKTFVEYINLEENVQSTLYPTTPGSFRNCTVWLTKDLDLKDWEEQVPVEACSNLQSQAENFRIRSSMDFAVHLTVIPTALRESISRQARVMQPDCLHFPMQANLKI